MRIEMSQAGEVVAIAETTGETLSLLNFIKAMSVRAAKPKVEKVVKHRKAYEFQTCTICGARKKGMKRHMNLKHPDQVAVSVPVDHA